MLQGDLISIFGQEDGKRFAKAKVIIPDECWEVVSWAMIPVGYKVTGGSGRCITIGAFTGFNPRGEGTSKSDKLPVHVSFLYYEINGVPIMKAHVTSTTHHYSYLAEFCQHYWPGIPLADNVWVIEKAILSNLPHLKFLKTPLTRLLQTHQTGGMFGTLEEQAERN